MDQEKLKELFESISSDIMTPDVQLQISTLFESAIAEAVEAKEKELEEKNEAELADFKEELVEQVDEYLNYFSKEFIAENTQVIEDVAKVKLAEKVLRNFGQMVEAFNISLSEDSISSEDELEELQTENNKLVNKLIESEKEVVTIKKAAFIAEASTELATDVQREKLFEMAKGLEFEEDTFAAKLKVLVDTITSTKSEIKEDKQLEDKEEDQALHESTTKKPSDRMASYLKYIK